MIRSLFDRDFLHLMKVQSRQRHLQIFEMACVDGNTCTKHIMSNDQWPSCRLMRSLITLQSKAHLSPLAFQEASKKDTTPSGLLDDLPEINSVFGHDSMEGIQAALESCTNSWAKPALELLRRYVSLSRLDSVAP